jgi:hypothetical protein
LAQPSYSDSARGPHAALPGSHNVGSSSINKANAMPQSTKDSKGGKSSSTKATHSKGQASEAAAKKNAGRNANSPTGPQKHGEKKTTP